MNGTLKMLYVEKLLKVCMCVYFYTASFSPLLLRGGPDNSPQAGVSEFHAEAQ